MQKKEQNIAKIKQVHNCNIHENCQTDFFTLNVFRYLVEISLDFSSLEKSLFFDRVVFVNAKQSYYRCNMMLNRTDK